VPEATRILRDDLLAQLRATRWPLTTAQLQRHAAHVPTPGAAVLLPPIREQVYRVLCALHRDGLVARAPAERVGNVWLAAPSPADEEIAALEAAFAAEWREAL
jgi:hypothetical protein